MNKKTVYGRSTNGKIKQWSISVDKVAEDCSVIEIEHGFVDGKKQINARYIKSGKNIGKKNETTPYQQAVSEAKSMLSKKVDEGYSANVDTIPKDDDGLFLPMLAHSFDKHSAKIKFPCWVQPKLDGVRMLAKKYENHVAMWSRKGKEIEVPDKINKQLNSFMKLGECFDGELYVHGWDFQRVISAVKKKRPDTDLLEYHIYDVPHLTNTFESRFLNKNWQDNSIDSYPNLKLVNTSAVDSHDNLTQLENFYVNQNYEGVMARNANSLYKYKNRSYDLQKVKRFQDEEFEIIGGKDGTGKESGLVIFKCINEDGREFDVRPKGNRELRKIMFDNLNDYIGKELKVRFQGRTSDNIPRFPVGLGVRPRWDS